MISFFGAYNSNELTLVGLALATLAARTHNVKYYYTGEKHHHIDARWDDQVVRVTPAIASEARQHKVCVWLGEHRKLFKETCRQGLRVKQILIPTWQNLDEASIDRLSSYDLIVCPNEVMFSHLAERLPRTMLNVLAPGYVPRLGEFVATMAKSSQPVTAHFNKYTKVRFGTNLLVLLSNLATSLDGVEVRLFKYGSWSREQRRFLKHSAHPNLRVIESPSKTDRRYHQCRAKLFLDLSVRTSAPYFAQEALACDTPVIDWGHHSSLRLVVPSITGARVNVPEISGYLQHPLGHSELVLKEIHYDAMINRVHEVIRNPGNYYGLLDARKNIDAIRGYFEDNVSGMFDRSRTLV